MLTLKNSNKLPEQNELTVDELRKYKGLEHLTDTEAENIAGALKEFSLLTYQMYEHINHTQNEQP